MSNKRKKLTAVQRGRRAIIIGLILSVITIVCMFAEMTFTTNNSNTLGMILTALVMPGTWAIYIFGFAFANWKEALQKTKDGAVEGGAVLGIGLLFSHLFNDKRFGMWGWLYFLLRVSWNIGMGWIPGVRYGIKAIKEEQKACRDAGLPVEHLFNFRSETESK